MAANRILRIAVACVIAACIAGGCTGCDFTGVRDVSPQEAADLIRDNEDNPDFIVLDVRPAERYAEGYIAGAINIDVNLPAFSDEVARLEKEDTYLVYCMAGITSRTAIEIMQELGFKRIYFLEGGINAWKEAGLPVVK